MKSFNLPWLSWITRTPSFGLLDLVKMLVSNFPSGMSSGLFLVVLSIHTGSLSSWKPGMLRSSDSNHLLSSASKAMSPPIWPFSLPPYCETLPPFRSKRSIRGMLPSLLAPSPTPSETTVYFAGSLGFSMRAMGSKAATMPAVLRIAFIAMMILWAVNNRR
jgi:hypothetical protein